MSLAPIAIDIKFDAKRNYDTLATALAPRQVIDVNQGDQNKTLDGVKYVLVWQPDKTLFERLPDLEVIFSLGAGVDHIFSCSELPDVPIVRFVDPDLTTRMSEYVCLQCLMHLRQMPVYAGLQTQAKWQELDQPKAAEITIGIMGMGVLGTDAAKKLKTLGFNVIGYSRTKKAIDGIKCFEASEQDDFLSQSHFIVNLLPLTKATRGMFNAELFSKLKRHDVIASPVFINAGRGASQIQADIVSAIKNGGLGGASLDVFETEPLDETSELWRLPGIIITPHMAAVSEKTALAKHVKTQIERYESGKALQYVVEKSRGY